MMSQHLSRSLVQFFARSLPGCLLLPLAVAWSAEPAWSAGAAGAGSSVTFDLPQTVAAMPVACAAAPAVSALAVSSDSPGGIADFGDDYRLVQLDLTLSIIIDGLSGASIDQLVVEIRPQGGRATVVDYAPRTELASGYSGEIEVVQSEEQNRLTTLSLQSQYPGVGSGGLTGTNGDKNSESLKFQRVAPLHVVAASGTRQRGRAVHFKFRATDQQILEGERPLSLTLRVPADWRSEMMEVAVVADSLPSGLSINVASWAGWEPSPQRLAAARFLVAAYRADCAEARAVTAQLAAAEARMRRQLQPLVATVENRLPAAPGGVWTPVSRGLDWSRGWNRSSGQELAEAAALSLHRALAGTLQPHDDRSFGRLPDETRGVILEYLQARQRFVRLKPSQAASDDHQSSLTVAGT